MELNFQAKMKGSTGISDLPNRIIDEHETGSEDIESGRERGYPRSMLPLYLDFVENVWIPDDRAVLLRAGPCRPSLSTKAPPGQR